MPQEYDITKRPEAPTRPPSGTATSQVLARPDNYLSAMPADNSGLHGLVQGLAAISPALQQYALQGIEKTRQATEDRARADAAKLEGPKDTLTGEPVALPETVAPIYGDAYRRSYGTALAQRAGLETKQDLVAQYEQQKDLPDFNTRQFLAEGRAKALQGIQDPHMVSIVGGHVEEAVAAIRGQDMQRLMRRQEENKETTAVTLAQGFFTPDMDATKLASEFFTHYVPQMGSIQLQPRQAAQRMLEQVQNLSNAAGGRPELFDAFDVDHGGTSIRAQAPELHPHILRAKAQATSMRDAADDLARQEVDFKVQAQVDDDIRTAPELYTDGRAIADIKARNYTVEKALSYRRQAQKALEDRAGEQAIISDADQGRLGYYDPKVQKAELERRGAPLTAELWKAATTGDAKGAAVIADRLMQLQSRTGSTVTVGPLERLIDTVVTTLPSAGGPNATFDAGATVFKAMGGDPIGRSRYFKGDAEQVMEEYTNHVASGVDPKTAYAAAYRTVDPEYKAAIAKRVADPAVQEQIGKAALKAVEGSSFMPRLLGGDGRPDNISILQMASSAEARRFLTLRPDALDNPKLLEKHLDQWTAQNYVMDTTSHTAVRVPPALSGPHTQKALSGYSEELTVALKAKGQLPEGGTIQYVLNNPAQGTYSVLAVGAGVHKEVGKVALGDIVNRYNIQNTVSQEEGAQLQDYRKALAAGRELPALPPALASKASAVNFFSLKERAQMAANESTKFNDRLRSVPDMGYGKPTNQDTPPPTKGTTKFDPKLTANMASELAFGPGSGGAMSHGALATSLTTQREGVALTAYMDPNPKAGMNIGAGYNLKANAATVDADLQAIGVPKEGLAAVKAGQASITPEQVKRLTQLTMARHEDAAKKVVESSAPGLWDRMLPAQRAVLMDISYQTGNVGSYKKAIQALSTGDAKQFVEETRTFYDDRTGSRVEDKRGFDLRASLLAGPSTWNARLSLASPKKVGATNQ